MTRATLIQDLFLLLAIGGAAILLSLWGWAFYGIGHKRGVNDRPDKLKQAWDEEHFKRVVAEERADTAERTSKRFETALLEAVAAKQGQGLALVEKRTGVGR